MFYLSVLINGSYCVVDKKEEFTQLEVAKRQVVAQGYEFKISGRM